MSARPVPDPYRALGLARGASEAEIKAAHRRLAKRYHPDSAGGDTDRFLQVQEAYKLLVDPLRRREWDARHAPGPVRASERAQTRARAANGRWTKAEQASEPAPERERPPSASRDPASRTYTWSASEVPWWEEGTARENRRQPGRKRPRESDAGREADAGAPPADFQPAQDFDVYNRSSGAAWSMAARAYFRRGDADLPRRGSFRQQGGSQPLTAARARAAAEEEARRDRPAGAASAPRPQEHRRRPRPPAGVVHDAETISELRAAARERLFAARWPSLRQRLVYALLAWLPVSLLIGYGGAWASGCELGSAECPPDLPLVQAGIAALALGALILLPRVAYALTMAAAAVAVVGLAIGILAPRVLILATPLLLLAQLAVAVVLLSTGAGRPSASRRFSRGAGR